MGIHIKSPEEQQLMRAAGKAAGTVLEFITPHVKAGISTDELNTLCHNYIVDGLGLIPAPLGYGEGPGRPPFPKSVCTSVNHVVCHGIPGPKPLKKGDVVNIDVTVIKNGFHGDTSKMFTIGEPKIQAKNAIDVALKSMWLGIHQVKPGGTLRDIGRAIQTYVEANRCSVVREYCGHGIGKVFHEDPQVLHYDDGSRDFVLQEGMTFTIEPMVNAGKRHTRLLPDAWTVITKDRSPSAQWEHTILVTKDGFEVLTLRDEERAAGYPEKGAIA